MSVPGLLPQVSDGRMKLRIHTYRIHFYILIKRYYFLSFFHSRWTSHYTWVCFDLYLQSVQLFRQRCPECSRKCKMPGASTHTQHVDFIQPEPFKYSTWKKCCLQAIYSKSKILLNPSPQPNLLSRKKGRLRNMC